MSNNTTSDVMVSDRLLEFLEGYCSHHTQVDMAFDFDSATWYDGGWLHTSPSSELGLWIEDDGALVRVYLLAEQTSSSELILETELCNEPEEPAVSGVGMELSSAESLEELDDTEFESTSTGSLVLSIY